MPLRALHTPGPIYALVDVADRGSWKDVVHGLAIEIGTDGAESAPGLCTWALHLGSAPGLYTYALQLGSTPGLYTWALHVGSTPELCSSAAHLASSEVLWLLYCSLPFIVSFVIRLLRGYLGSTPEYFYYYKV